ncbi:MAG: class I SAM-dependent methyltransferase [Gemmatimonadota bacterium]
MAKWFEDESFWETLYPIMFSEERFQSAEDQVENILNLTGFGGRDVLDLCCGPGRHSVLLAKKGFNVTGVDRSAFLLRKARAHADRENVQVEWVEQDMRNFVRPDAFDLVLRACDIITD